MKKLGFRVAQKSTETRKVKSWNKAWTFYFSAWFYIPKSLRYW